MTLVSLSSYAQDSIVAPQYSPCRYSPQQQWIPTTLGGLSMLATGTIAHATSHMWTPSQFKAENKQVVDILQYGPMAFPWIMKICGAPTRSGWGRMATSHATATIAMAGSVYLLKDNVRSLRPDGTDYRSFPSGHTAWAYMGATMIARELGWKSPWYTMGAYTIASAVAMQRVADSRHHPADVAAGAGIGILATQLGYYIGDIIFKDRQIDNHASTGNEIINTTHLSLSNTFGIPFSKVETAKGSIYINSWLETSINISLALNNTWSIEGGVAMRSASVMGDLPQGYTYIAPLNSVGVNITPCYTATLSDKYAISVGVGGGYYRNFTLKSINNAINTNDNTYVGRASINGIIAISDHLNISAGIGYEVSPQSFELTPCDDYGIKATVKGNKTTHTLIMSISTNATF